MAAAARALVDAGADAIDVNLGCPVRRIVSKGVGAALLREPQLLSALLCAIRDAVPGVVSAKMRAGYDDFADALDLALCAQDAGIDFLTVHPRRRTDLYEGVADWNVVARIARELRVPVVGNGDLWYAADAIRLKARSGCAGVMIGRPALRNPWIFRQIAEIFRGDVAFEPSGSDVWDYLTELAEMLRSSIADSPRGALGAFKELSGYVIRAIPDADELGTGLLRLQDLDAMLSVLHEHLAGRASKDLDLGVEPRFGLAPRPTIEA